MVGGSRARGGERKREAIGKMVDEVHGWKAKY
jgi:hypothetical protein